MSEEEWYDRLAIEAKKIRDNKPTFYNVHDSLALWRGEIMGRGLYDGVFLIDIKIPRKFPFIPPIVRFLTPIWHVNIHKKKVCISILGKDWDPDLSVVQVIDTIEFVLTNPNPDDPLNLEASTMWKTDRETFIRKAKQMVREYALWNQQFPYSFDN